MAASKGYGCYACVCALFLVIFGFGLGFIIGYFVLKQPIYVTSVASQDRLPVYEDLDFVVDAVNRTDYRDLDEEFKNNLSDTQHDKNYSLFIQKKFKDFGLDQIELQHRKFLISPPDGDRLNKLKVTDHLGRIIFQTNFSNVQQLYAGVYGPSGSNFKVYAETVFVNHAESSDFKLLQQNKVKLEHKIFVARCGSIHLDNMIKSSQNYGAKALLFYVDPKHPPLYEHMCRSTSNIFLLKEESPEKALQSSSIGILVQQISYEDVEKLFRTDPKGISNRKIIHKWDYPISAKADLSTCEKCKALLEVGSSPVEQEMCNVIGRIHGQLEPDRYIIIGAHRNYIKTGDKLDTGTKTLLQLVDTFHTLKKQGWQPKRTLIFASFAAKNYGNLGAIKWLDENYEDLSQNAVFYINVESNSNAQHQIESSPETTTALFTAVSKAKKVISKFKEYDHDFSNRSATLSGYTDTSPFAYFAGIPAVDFNFGEFCRESTIEIKDNKSIIGVCSQAALSLALEFSDSNLVPYNLKYLVAQLSNSFETLFSFDSEYKTELHKYGLNLGELRNGIKEFEEKVRSFYESDTVRNYLLRRVVNDVIRKVLRVFLMEREIVKPLFKNLIFLPEVSSNLLKVYAFQGIVNLLQAVEKDPSTTNMEMLKSHYEHIVKSLSVASSVLDEIVSN